MSCSNTSRLAILLLATTGCGVPIDRPQPTPEPKGVHSWLAPATSGGKGGNGGVVYLLPTVVNPVGADVDQAFVTTAGRGGVGGKATIGAPGHDAPHGARGQFDLNLYPFTFDATGITPDMVTDVNGASLKLHLKDNLDPLAVMELDTLRIARGSRLELGCDVRIRARQVLIEEGGWLVVRGRDSGACVIGTGLRLDLKPGLQGGQVFIEAETFFLGGTLDLAGNPGAPGAAGGSGGSLTILAASLFVGEGAQVLANGGSGGDGADERELP